MHGIIGASFGKSAARLAALASSLGFGILIGWEAVVGATVLKSMSGIPKEISFALPLVAAILAGFYTSAGGLRGNAGVNLVQNFAKAVILIAAVGALILEAPLNTKVLLEIDCGQYLSPGRLCIIGWIRADFELGIQPILAGR